jgi:hypothetical protein
MPLTTFDINYRSAEKFFQDYLQLKQGALFVRAEKPEPPDTPLVINITVPRIDYAFQLNGIVTKIRDPKTADRIGKNPGMLIRLNEDLEKLFQGLNPKLLVDEKYEFLLALCDTIDDSVCIIRETVEEYSSTDDEKSSDTRLESTEASGQPVSDGSRTDDEDQEKPGLSQEKPGLSFEWLREATAQEEAPVEEEQATEIVEPPTQIKKDLTAPEREIIKPVAEFIMDLTKAMLRTGYYSPEHPGAVEAKHGLFEQFQKCLGDSQEIMVTNLEARQKTDILITGVLDEPVSVRTLVGAGKAGLFVPKLRDFFDRKGLMSFAIKKQITASHFESYIEIMSDPKADRSKNKKMGMLLSRALAEHGITEISTVFLDDIIVLEKNLPWRVEMAILRLTKDLKVLPMFKKQSDDAILNLKVKIIHDIIRPLKYAQYLKDLLVNCYIIAEHVEIIGAEEIEKVIIEGIPEDLLIPTSRCVFEELKTLIDLKAKDPKGAGLDRRQEGVKRIIKSLSRRMMQLKIKGVQRFLEELHNSGLLAFNELPPDVQYLVNTMKIVRDVKARPRVYISWVFQRLKPEDATVMLKCFRRVMPIIFEEETWDLGFQITLAVNKVKNETDLYSPKNKLPTNPFYFIFKDVSDMLAEAYQRLSTTSRLKVDQIVRRLGSKGVDLLNLILIRSEKPEVRQDAMETVVSMGEVARRWSLNVLEKREKEIGSVKNALAILREVGQANADTEQVRKFANSSDPLLQEEALHTLMDFKAKDLEPFIINALSSRDDKLRWRALTALGKLEALSRESTQQLLRIITADVPENKQLAATHSRNIAQLIQALGTSNNFKPLDHLENAIIKAVEKTDDSGKGFITRLTKKNPKEDQSTLLVAAFTTLGKIGSLKSSELLTNFSKGKSTIALEAQKALQLITSRSVKAL